MALASEATGQSGKQADIQPLLIGGEWIADTGAAITSVNPASGETNYQVAAAGQREVDAAVENAAQAASAASWRNMLPHQRARILSRMADCIDARADAFARAPRRENGTVVAEWGNQGGAAGATFRY